MQSEGGRHLVAESAISSGGMPSASTGELGLRGVSHRANSSLVSVPWAHHRATAMPSPPTVAPPAGEISGWLAPILFVTTSTETDISSAAGPSTDETTAAAIGRLDVTSSQTAGSPRPSRSAHFAATRVRAVHDHFASHTSPVPVRLRSNAMRLHCPGMTPSDAACGGSPGGSSPEKA